MKEAVDALHAVIGPDGPKIEWWQACIRAAIIFLVGIAYIRAAGAHTFGKGSPLDIVVSVIIGSNLSRAIIGSAPFLPCLAATAVLVGMHYLFAKLAHRWRWVGSIVKGQPRDLVRDGVIDEKMLAHYAITHQDLDEALREEGKEGTDGVKRVVLERSGAISVIREPGPVPPAG